MPQEQTNRLIDSLSPASQSLILQHCTPINLPLRTVLYRAEQRPAYAYFPTSGMASVISSTLNGGTAEVGIICREGVIGAFHLIGPAKISTECFMQLQGTGLRIPLPELRRAFLQSAEIRDRLLEFIQEHSLVGNQIAGCNRLHETEPRLARWLLMAQDQTGATKLNLTQEFIGMMLGTRRTTVSLVAGEVQRKGLIEISRGAINVLDRPGLQNLACDCYGITRDLLTNLYAQEWSKW